MSGYKRVNFYELCRLCATNQQKDKTHIFQEEGRKIQLQTKIQSCLSLTVCENDFLPKVVCSRCLRTLEVCYTFRQECVSSESMLSSYFKNFRYTEDFKKSGKVYIKDTAGKAAAIQPAAIQSEPANPTVAIASYVNEVKPLDVPFYAVQLPTIVNQQASLDNSKLKTEAKLLHNHHQLPPHANNYSTINLGSVKKNGAVAENLSNVVVNANGEVLNIAQLVDFESLIHQANNNVQKSSNPSSKKKKREDEQPLIKIDLTNTSELEPPSAVQAQTKKFASGAAYAIKVEDNKMNPSVIFNNLEFNTQTTTTTTTQNFNYNSIYNNNNNNSAVLEASTVNLNHLTGQDLQFPATPAASVRNFTSPLTSSNNSNSNNNNNNHHVKDESSISTSSASSQLQLVKTHTCEICQKGFKRREHLYQHVKLHTGFRPYTCESCNKSFMRKEHLLRHMTSHSGQKNFTCNICDKSFSRNDNLLKHKKTHDKQTSYTCDICQKQFVMKHYYLAHKLTHDGGGNGDKCGSVGVATGSNSTSNNNNSAGNVWNVLKTY